MALQNIIVFAAGRGWRMGGEVPKPLRRVGGRSLLGRQLARLAAGGASRIVVNVNTDSAAVIRDAISAECPDGMPAIEYSVEPSPYETAGGIVYALSQGLLSAEAPIIAVNADILTDYPYDTLQPIAAALPPQECYLVMVDNPPHHPNGDFALDARARLRSDTAASSLTFSGIGIYSPSLFLSLPPKEVIRLNRVIRHCVEDERAAGARYHGFWMDVGTPDALARANRELAEMSIKG